MIGNQAQDEFASSMHRAIVTTLRRDGSPASSLVAYFRDGDEIVFSTTADRLKAKTVANDPRVAVAILADDGKGRFLSVEGRAVVQSSDVVEGHIALNRQMRQDPAWQAPEGFAEKLAKDGRVLIRVTPTRVSGMVDHA